MEMVKQVILYQFYGIICSYQKVKQIRYQHGNPLLIYRNLGEKQCVCVEYIVNQCI